MFGHLGSSVIRLAIQPHDLRNTARPVTWSTRDQYVHPSEEENCSTTIHDPAAHREKEGGGGGEREWEADENMQKLQS